MKLKRILSSAILSAALLSAVESNAFWFFGKRPKNEPKSEIIKPQIKYSKKTFALKVPEGTFKRLDVEIRDVFDNLMFATKYENVTNFEKIYDVSQFSKGKYLVTIFADGKIYYDMIKVK
jgi:hypothetical protein